MPIWTCRQCQIQLPKVSMKRTRRGIYMDICLTCSPMKPDRKSKQGKSKDSRRANFAVHANAPRKYVFAKILRRRATPAEVVLWNELQHVDGWRFQVPILGWIVDFYHDKRRLAIELDGGYHSTEKQIRKDETKDTKLFEFGITVIRFTNDQIISDVASIVKDLKGRP